MLEQNCDEFYYVTVMNENYAQPSLVPDSEGDIVKGLYRLSPAAAEPPVVRLVGSGAILREVIAASDLLAKDFGVAVEVWSATSFSEVARDAADTERWNRLHPEEEERTSHLARCFPGNTPIVATTDYVRAYPQLIASYLLVPFTALGTDGFGRSDTRKALRTFFEVDRFQIILAALQLLARAGTVEKAALAEAIKRYGIDPDRSPASAV